MLHLPCVGGTGGAGTAYPSGAPEFTPCFFVFCFFWIRVVQSFSVYCFLDHCLPCVFFFWQSIDYPSSIYQLFITPLVSSNISWYIHK